MFRKWWWRNLQCDEISSSCEEERERRNRKGRERGRGREEGRRGGGDQDKRRVLPGEGGKVCGGK